MEATIQSYILYESQAWGMDIPRPMRVENNAWQLIFLTELQTVLVDLLVTAGCWETHALVGELVSLVANSIEEIDRQPQEDHDLNDLVGQTSGTVH